MSAGRITRIALLSAILYTSKLALEFLPNIELVSLLTILYTLVFGKEAFIIVTVFNLLEVVQWGLGSWVITYLYIWPLLVLGTLVLKKLIGQEFLIWAVFSGVFGLTFGAFFALYYIPIDKTYAWGYFLSGLPWDVVHCIGNFVLMLVLGKPMHKLLSKVGNLSINN